MNPVCSHHRIQVPNLPVLSVQDMKRPVTHVQGTKPARQLVAVISAEHDRACVDKIADEQFLNRPSLWLCVHMIKMRWRALTLVYNLNVVKADGVARMTIK